MIDTVFLKNAAQTVAIGNPDSNGVARQNGKTNATLQLAAGQLSLQVADQQLLLQPGREQRSGLSAGEVWVARSTDQTAVILNSFSRRSDTTFSLKQTPQTIAGLIPKLAAQALPHTMGLSTTVARASNGDTKLNIAHTPLSIALPITQSSKPSANGAFSALLDTKQASVIVARQGKPVMTISLNKAEFNQVATAASLYAMRAKGLQLSGIPEALARSLKLTTEVSGASAARINAHASTVSMVTAYHQPLAKIRPPASLLAKLPALPASLITETASAPMIASRLIDKSESSAVLTGHTKSVDVHGTVKNLAKNLLAHTGSTNQALKHLLEIFSQAQVSGAARTTLDAISANIAGPASDATASSSKISTPTKEQVARLVHSASLPITPTVINSPVISDSFSSSLVTLFQLVLAGRSPGKPPSHLLKTEELTQQVIDKGAAKPAMEAKPRVASELASLNKQFDLLTPMKTLLANHQSAVLSNIEARNQGLDQLYFCLPVRSDFVNRESEVLIKREDNKDEADPGASCAERKWSLAMKLDIGNNGELLAKSKITENTISLDLYASNQSLLESVNRTLPLLIERLTSLGMVVRATSTQQGKIPDSLRTSPYQFFAVTV